MTQFGHHVLGETKNDPDAGTQDLVNPASGQRWATAEEASATTIQQAVDSARRTFDSGVWSQVDPSFRAKTIWRLAQLIEEDAETLARHERLAAGKTAATTRAEASRVADWYRFFGGAADKIDGRLVSTAEGVESRVVREPIGVVAAITPFNGALSLGAWKIAPALASGNSIVVKPPLAAPASTLRVAELAIQAGVPAGVFNVVPGGADVGKTLVEHPAVDMVSFTGSTEAAITVGVAAARGMKRYVCEAGGKSAQIIFADADLDSAKISAATGVFSNSGQSCVAGSRVLVEDAVYDDVVTQLVATASSIDLGDPEDGKTQVGPIASRSQLERVERLVQQAIKDGARVLSGGRRADDSAGGFYFLPTVLSGVTPDMQIWNEEVFGPVVIVERFSSDDEAVALANATDFGLAAGIWTSNIRRAHVLPKSLKAGTVWVNTYRNMHYRVPFGGYKQSGLGRENGLEVLDEYCTVKAITHSVNPILANPFSSR